MLTSLLVAGALGCGAGGVASTDLGGDFGTLNGATLELSVQGGLAGLQIHQLIRHDDRTFVSTTRPLCTVCGVPFDSTSGILSAAVSDSLFNVVWQRAPFSLKDDYGHTPNSADMQWYTLRVTFNGQTKTITADDGSMPQPMRAINEAMRAVIAAQRR
jgi:hypothetical protein